MMTEILPLVEEISQFRATKWRVTFSSLKRSQKIKNTPILGGFLTKNIGHPKRGNESSEPTIQPSCFHLFFGAFSKKFGLGSVDKMPCRFYKKIKHLGTLNVLTITGPYVSL